LKQLEPEELFSGGWVKIHRSILLHPVFQDSELLHVFLYCLAKANHKPGRVLSPESEEGELTVERGQFIFGQRKAAKETGVNARTAHRKLILLEKLGILSRSVSRRFTLVTVNNYSRYQDNPNQADSFPDSLVCPTLVPLLSHLCLQTRIIRMRRMRRMRRMIRRKERSSLLIRLNTSCQRFS